LYPVVAIVGPTATGKTEFAFRLARFLKDKANIDCSFVNADAFALYKGFDIISAKPTSKDIVLAKKNIGQKFEFCQLDVLDLKETASVSVYQKKAREDIDKIQISGQLPIIVGGSALYTNALLDDIKFPGTDPEIRQKYNNLLNLQGKDYLYNLLEKKDLASAKILSSENTRRVIRALEVIELTGQPFRASLPKRNYFYQPTLVYAAKWPKELLKERIYKRTVNMINNGLILEIDKAREKAGKTAVKAIGFAQTCDYLDGKINQNQLIDLISLATFQLAKKQYKWFLRDKRIKWLEIV
jgi:tRNA dimethylallyltransferase